MKWYIDLIELRMSKEGLNDHCYKCYEWGWDNLLMQ